MQHLLFWLSVSWKLLAVDKQIPLKTGRRTESCLRVYKVEVIIKLSLIYVIFPIPCSWFCSSLFQGQRKISSVS